MNHVSQYGWTPAFQLPLGGLGSIGDSQQQIAGQVGSSLTQISGALAKIPGAQVAAPFVAIAGALANIVSLFGPNPNNTITTGWVNQIEADVLKPNIDAWNALDPSDKSPETQAAALAIFQEGWNQVVQLCSNAQLGSAGTNCLADRQNGACHWTTTGQTPGVPPNCGNWWVWYHDPIANDPAVAANIAAANAPTQTPSTTTPPTSTAPAAAGGPSTSNPPTNGATSAPPTSTDNTYLYGGLALLGIAGLFLLLGGD